MRWKSMSWKLLLLIVIAAIVLVWLMKAPIISWYLTDKLKVPTTVSRVSMGTTETVIHNFRIVNPRGFKMKSAFEAETISITYRLKQLRGNPSEIDEIVVDDIHLGIECANPLCSKNNWTAIGGGMAKKEEHEKNRQVVIHKLILTNLQVEVRGLGFGKPPILKQIARLEFDEINSATGFPTDKLIRAIFKGVGLQDYIPDLLNPQNALKKYLPGVFGDAEE